MKYLRTLMAFEPCSFHLIAWQSGRTNLAFPLPLHSHQERHHGGQLELIRASSPALQPTLNETESCVSTQRSSTAETNSEQLL